MKFLVLLSSRLHEHLSCKQGLTGARRVGPTTVRVLGCRGGRERRRRRTIILIPEIFWFSFCHHLYVKPYDLKAAPSCEASVHRAEMEQLVGSSRHCRRQMKRLQEAGRAHLGSGMACICSSVLWSVRSCDVKNKPHQCSTALCSETSVKISSVLFQAFLFLDKAWCLHHPQCNMATDTLVGSLGVLC